MGCAIRSSVTVETGRLAVRYISLPSAELLGHQPMTAVQPTGKRSWCDAGPARYLFSRETLSGKVPEIDDC